MAFIDFQITLMTVGYFWFDHFSSWLFALTFLSIKLLGEKRGFESEMSSASLSPVSCIQTQTGNVRNLIWDCLVNSGEEIKHLSATWNQGLEENCEDTLEIQPYMCMHTHK